MRYLVDDESYLIMVEPDPYTIDMAHVKLISHLRNVEAMLERTDPKVLLVAVKRGRDSLQLTLIFESSQSCLATKRSIEERRRQSKDEDLLLVLSYFASIELSLQV